MKKIFYAKNIVGLILLILTGIFAASAFYYDVFTPFFKGFQSGDFALIALITLIFGPWFVLFLSPAVFIIWDYIGEKYGKKQHLLNACWLVLCCAFAYFAGNFPNVLIKIGQLPDISEFSLQCYRFVIVLTTILILCWLCHLVDYYKHLLEYFTTPRRKPRGENIVSAN